MMVNSICYLHGGGGGPTAIQANFLTQKGGHMNRTNILKGHELFSNFRFEDVDKISEFSERKTYEENTLIFKHGDEADRLFVLLEGEVHLTLPAQDEGFGLIISKVGKDDLFGLSPLLGSKQYTLEARAVKSTRVIAIDVKKFNSLLKENSLVGFSIMTEVAQAYFTRYIEITKRLQGIVTQVPLITNM